MLIESLTTWQTVKCDDDDFSLTGERGKWNLSLFRADFLKLDIAGSNLQILGCSMKRGKKMDLCI